MKGRRRTLERRLAAVKRFSDPRVDLEQYPTPPAAAAALVHFADMRSDIKHQLIVDLGSGTGMLAIACALREPTRVVGIERDRAAISIAIENVKSVSPAREIEFIHGDVFRSPLRSGKDATVVMNPPFGAQHDNLHADRRFLAVASTIGRVSYSFHNAGSQAFIEAFAADHGGTVTDAAATEFELARQFSFHESDQTTIPVELYRIQWSANQ